MTKRTPDLVHTKCRKTREEKIRQKLYDGKKIEIKDAYTQCARDVFVLCWRVSNA